MFPESLILGMEIRVKVLPGSDVDPDPNRLYLLDPDSYPWYGFIIGFIGKIWPNFLSVFPIRFISIWIRIRFVEKRIRIRSKIEKIPTFFSIKNIFLQKMNCFIIYEVNVRKTKVWYFLKTCKIFLWFWLIFFLEICHAFGCFYATQIHFMKPIRIRLAEIKRIRIRNTNFKISS